MTKGTHETLERREDIQGSSDRSFGLVIAAAFAIAGLWPLLKGGPVRWWALIAAAVILGAALFSPALLRPVNRLWIRLGIWMGVILAPVALGVLFYLVMTPIAVLARVLKKDPLRLKRDSGAQSYWIERNPPGPPADSMKNQF
jgi:hypothetical protein